MSSELPNSRTSVARVNGADSFSAPRHRLSMALRMVSNALRLNLLPGPTTLGVPSAPARAERFSIWAPVKQLSQGHKGIKPETQSALLAGGKIVTHR